MSKVLFVLKAINDEPLGIMYMAAVLKKHGHECDIAYEEEEDIIKTFKEFKPDIVGFYITTGTEKHYIGIAKRFKKIRKVFSLFGGPHPTFFPEMVNEEGVDAVCIGEGEYALLDLANKLEKGQSITKIKNLWIKRRDKIFRNGLRPLIRNLNELPFPDRETLYLKFDKFRNAKVRFFLTTRGCPYNCSYCYNHSYKAIYYNEKIYLRRVSIGYIIQELNEVKKRFGLNFVRFIDNTFNINRGWVKEFCKKYKKEISVPFSCNMRADLVEEEMIKDLKEAGLHSVSMAIESGNDFLRNQILNRQMTREHIIKAAELLRKYKINFMTQNIVGTPGETLTTAFETLKINQECKPAYAWVSLFQPYPKTRCGEYAVERGYFNGDYSILCDSFYEDLPLKLENKKELVNLQKLFAVAVEWPFLTNLIKLAIKAPKNNFLFKSIFVLFKSCCYQTRIGFANYTLSRIRQT